MQTADPELAVLVRRLLSTEQAATKWRATAPAVELARALVAYRRAQMSGAVTVKPKARNAFMGE
jgi:hypothetical protein